MKGTEVITVTPTASLQEAALTLRANRIGAVLVVDDVTGDGRIAGILSERDIVGAIADFGASALEKPVSDVMSADVVSCSPTDTVEQLMETMTARRIRHLPVVQDTALVGIVSIGDVVKKRLAEISDESKALQDYITTGR